MELPTEGLGPRSADETAETADLTDAIQAAEFTDTTEVPDEPYEPYASAEPDGGGEPGGQRRATGEPRVDAALARLDELAGRPVTEHRAIFEDVHRRLRDVLGELDTRDPAPSRDARGAERRAGR
jgi:hypothetical protein